MIHSIPSVSAGELSRASASTQALPVCPAGRFAFSKTCRGKDFANIRTFAPTDEPARRRLSIAKTLDAVGRTPVRCAEL